MLTRPLLVVAGLFGAAGVAAAAMSAHLPGGERLGNAAELLLVHAAALVALAALARHAGPGRGVITLVAIGFTVGTALFSADMAMRSFWGEALFPYAAPTGGSTLIGAWLVLALAAAFGAVGRRPE